MQEFYQHLSKDLTSLKDRDCLALYEQLLRVKDPFNTPVIWPIPSFSSNINGLHRWLPISIFKHSSNFWYRGKSNSAKTFLSSGTTSQDRSQALFSKEGLCLYQEASVALFKYVLEAVSGKELVAFNGISVIPSVDEWPDSSLAQMVDWLSQTLPIKFVKEEELAEAVNSSEKPVWIFGTGFHFINLFDSHPSLRLPPGSLIIETGGTKGRSREVARNEFYQILCDYFHIESDQIISEYGMCELASQAYDFVPYHQKNCTRRFRFPKWVMLQVCDNKTEPLDKGEGALIVHDSLRVDYPYPLRTDDLVNLDGGCFFLKGRIAQAPLKGCSLQAERVLSRLHRTNSAPLNPLKTRLKKSINLTVFKKAVIDYLRNPQTAMLLAKDTGSLKNSQQLLANLSETIEATDLITAARTANPFKIRGAVLLILPENHPLVGVYPIIIGALCDFDLVVRIPEKFKTGFVPNFIEMLNAIEGEGVSIQSRSYTYRLSRGNKDFERIVVYGSNQTINTIQNLAETKVTGFGDALSICDLRFAELSSELLSKVAFDAFSLAQNGCMSTRLVIAASNFTDRMADIISAKGQYHWNARLDLGALMAIDSEYFRYHRMSFYCSPKKIDPLVTVKKYLDFKAIRQDLDKIISQHSFCLPIVILDHISDDEILSLDTSLKLVTNATHNVPNTQTKNEVEFRAIGQAQSPPFDGRHQNIPLFN